ncbi:glycosyltransferase family 2 protein, partial [Candidatus Daviesbacteria bacterium]|nr:glycosyltransferase family 2 protein [Candidatus Daviesbacteria bacterium]
YNEAQALPELFEEIKQVNLKKYEIVAINDGSTDHTASVLKELEQQDPSLKTVYLRRRQGKWAALEAGFKNAVGQIIITLDSDLQDNPIEISKLLVKLQMGYDLVSGARIKRSDSFYKVLMSRFGNFLASSLTRKNFLDLNSPFKVYKRKVIEDYKVAEVPINHRPRLFGKSKFGIVKYLRIIYDLILVLLLFSGSGRITRDYKNLSKRRYKGRAPG